MVSRLGFLAISFSILGVAIAMPPQAAPKAPPSQEPLAEQQFKNIVSFKGAKAADIIPSMEFMSASLNVSCDYCHVEDRSSDEKEHKKTAREMIAMQRDINNKNFDGKNEVTCATCHGGHTHPTPLPPVEGLQDRVMRSNEVSAADVLIAYAKSTTSDAQQPITSIKFAGTSTTKAGPAPAETSTVEITYSGEKYVVSTHGPKGDQSIGFNGSLAWFTTPRGVQAVPFQFAERFVRENTLISGADSLPKLDNPRGGTAKIGGKDQVVVSGTITGSTTRATLFFDKDTHLLTRMSFYYPTILGSMAQINDYGDYTRVNGNLLPMKVTQHNTEGDTTMVFQNATANPTVTPTTFDPPKK